ncbi:MAG: beta-galactosidase [Thalassotalea sp.]
MKLRHTPSKLALVFLGLTSAFASALTLAVTPAEKISQLNSLIISAQTQELDVSREQMTIRMAELFLDWADWDEANQNINIKFYQEHPNYKNSAASHAENLAGYERDSVNTILDNAINELSQVINNTIIRKPVPVIDFRKVSIEQGEFRLKVNSNVSDNNEANNSDINPREINTSEAEQTIFLSSYTWKPSDDLTNPFFGNLHSSYISPTFITDEQGNTAPWRINAIINDNDQRIGQVFINHSAIPQWIINKYPNIGDTERLFSKYLIDHPGAKELFTTFFNTYIPPLKDKRATALGYMMFNEPSFFTEAGKWNTGGVSAAAMSKFRLWLATQHSSINNLNTIWSSNYASFDDINITLPMNSNLKGSAIWYDWMRFNQIRVTNWFSFLDSEITKHDSDAKTHIKLMPWLWNASARDHGMDFESLLEITDIIGFDANSEYLSHRTNTPWYQDNYSFDWQSPTLSFDFFSSVQPDQVLWDSENHFFNKGSFQLKDVDPDYVRAIYWLGATHGLDGVSTWMWGRNTDGSIIENRGYNSEYITGVTHQPLGFHELTRTIMDINAHHQDIVKLQKQNKAIRIFYSETSAISQNDYMDSIRDTHRTLFFNGIALGFATQKIIENHLNDWGFIVVNDSVQVTAAELAALKNYADNGGTILIDSVSLKTDQYGRKHAENLLPSGDNVMSYASLADLNSKALELAENKNLRPAINLIENSEAYNINSNKKVAWRTVKNSDNSYTLSLVNTATTSINITINALANEQNLVLSNLMTGQVVDNNTNLAIRETLLLKATLVDAEIVTPAPTPIPDPVPAPTPTPETGENNDADKATAATSAGSVSYLLILLALLMKQKLIKAKNYQVNLTSS